MSTHLGKQAVVVGAGMAGLTAARALADFFERVIVLENDALPQEAAHRPGTPQSRHLHALLAGGLQTLSHLFADFEKSLSQAGAVPLRMSSDYRVERPGYDPFPQRDLGIHVYCMTRPLLEFTVRKRLGEYRKIELRERRRAVGFIPAARQAAVGAVRCDNPNGECETLPADLVVDASEHASLTLSLLRSIGWPLPEETSIGVDIGYATTLFEVPENESPGSSGVTTFPEYPRVKRRGTILPVEGNRRMLTLAGRYNEKPPADWDGFLEHARQLRTPTIFNVIRRAKRSAEIVRFGFKASRWRHFERLDKFPGRLLPFGDTICRFNPIYGQGMSVAALEAGVLNQMLGESRTENDSFPNLAAAFFAEAAKLIATPWAAAAIPDFIDARTEGQRPADFEDSLKFSAALLKLEAEDAAVHKLLVEVQSLLKPPSAYRTPELSERIRAVMAKSQAAN